MTTPLKITQDMAVAFDYIMTDEAGTVLDNSYDKRYPYEYLHGYGQIIPGLEAAMEGRTAGEKFQVTVPPEQGYGVRDEGARSVLPREEFTDDELVPGNQLYIMSETGPRRAVVLAFDAEKVILDSNHELAGKILHYEVAVLGVRQSTFSERTCGHVHDPIAERPAQ